MDSPRLRSDCARCAALCCVALGFERSSQFAFDKAAGSACSHLGRGHRCTIHHDLSSHGFPGCARYDCLGAGQRVIQEVFAGRDLDEEPALAPRVFEAFRRLRQVHELLLLLEAAAALTLPADVEERRQTLWAALCPPQGFSEASLARFERAEVSGEVMAFLRSLRRFVSARQTRRLPVICAGERAG